MAMTVTLLRDFLMIQHVEAPNASPLILLDPSPSAPKYAKVLAIGPGRVSEAGVLFPVPCAVGDTILLNGDPGTDKKIGTETVRFILPGDILGIVAP